jgi:hypothetical protein
VVRLHRGALAGAIGSTAFLAACSAIIGTRELTLVSEDGGFPGNDGAAHDGATQGEASTPGDAGTDTAIPLADTGADTSCGADFFTDKENCGRCGHSCLGGTCKDGSCQAFPIVQGQGGPWPIAIDKDNVYWGDVEDDKIVMSKKDGTGVVVLAQGAANNVNTPLDIAVSGDGFVYWANRVYASATIPGSVARCSIANGCSGKGQVLANKLDYPTSVATDGTNVFWIENYGDLVGRVTKDGTGAGTLVANLTFGHAVALDDTFVYFTSDNTVGRLPKTAASAPDGGPFQTIYTNGFLYALNLEVDDTTVYWATDLSPDPSVIQSAPKTGVTDGGKPNQIAGSLHGPLNVAVDATNIYFIEIGPGGDTFTDSQLSVCPKAGCPFSGPTVLAKQMNNAKDLKIDDTAVYWTVRGNTGNEGAILKIAKP